MTCDELSSELQAFAHPTLLLFVAGREQARFSRAIPRAQVERAERLLREDPLAPPR